jgi:hypothetical protein
MSNSILTVFRNSDGILSKRIKLDGDGKIFSDGSECRMARGVAFRAKLDDVDALAELIADMRSNEALALGRLRDDLPDKCKVVLARELQQRKTPSDVIARTTAFLQFAPAAPAYMLIDYDTKEQPRAVADKLEALGGFWPAVKSAAPGLAKAALVKRDSTTAWLFHDKTEKWLKKSAGRHIYLPVQDGADIERALKTLHERLWLQGMGYYVVGKIGQLLDRSIIDASVFGAERLIFEGPPELVWPVAQDQSRREPRVRDGDTIDTRLVIPALNEAEQTRLAQLKAAARDQLKPEVARERRRWAKAFAVRHGLSEDEAEKIANNAGERHSLHPAFTLTFDNLGSCSVAEVLAKADDYVGETLADPLEGPDYGRCKAKVFRLPDGRLMINSKAHGGIKYRLEGQGVGLDHFYSYMEKPDAYIYTPTGVAWSASRVNARIAPVPLLDAAGQPVLDNKGKPGSIPASKWLDRHRTVEQVTWCPGKPALIKNQLVMQGGRIAHNAVACFNLYLPPTLKLGDGNKAGRWVDHVHRLYPDEADHIIKFNAHRVQRPDEKINHALVLGGAQGVGKDTLLAPVREAVGPWNFQEVGPTQVMGRFNGFLKSVILRISEARDLGDSDRFKFYDHMKSYIVSPPEVLRVDEKNLREHNIINCCGVIITTNHKTDGIYLPADDRRHFVAWTDLRKEDFAQSYWDGLWHWYEHQGGCGHVTCTTSTSATSTPRHHRRRPRRSGRLSVLEVRQRMLISPTASMPW